MQAGEEAQDAEILGTTAVVVASHGNGEEDALTAALSAGVPYVALVASIKRGEAVRASLDLPSELAAQLHTPAGVDIGAESPEEIAVSILAELIVELRANPASDQLEPDSGREDVDRQDADRERSSKKKDKKGHSHSDHAVTNGHSEIAVTNGHTEHEPAAGESAEHAYGFAPALLADPIHASCRFGGRGRARRRDRPGMRNEGGRERVNAALGRRGRTGLLLRDRLPGCIRLAASRRRKPLALT